MRSPIPDIQQLVALLVDGDVRTMAGCPVCEGAARDAAAQNAYPSFRLKPFTFEQRLDQADGPMLLRNRRNAARSKAAQEVNPGERPLRSFSGEVRQDLFGSLG